MKVIMYGFGSGNNIEPWLEFFEKNYGSYKLTFVCNKFQLDINSFPHIEVIELKSLYFVGFRFLSHLRIHNYDVVYIQGLYDYLIILQLLLMAHAKFRVVNIWNNQNFRKGSFKNKKIWQIPLYRFIYSLTDRFYFTWYGTYYDFGKLFPSQKPKAYIKPWGIRNQIMISNPIAKSKFAQTYLSNLHRDELFLFWPENISPDEHLEVFIQALRLIQHKERLRVLIFCGHQKAENDFSTYLRSLIHQYKLNCVDLVLGNYLPYSDIMAFWERADLSVKLSTKDQLSNGIIEALFFKTPMLLNNWMPYEKLTETGFYVHLTELNPESIANALSNIIGNLKMDRNYYEKDGIANVKIIREKFNFDRNIMLLMQDLNNTVKEDNQVKNEKNLG